MFERFTERARQVVVLAQEEARTLKHNYIGTEHILLGLLREGQGAGAQILAVEPPAAGETPPASPAASPAAEGPDEPDEPDVPGGSEGPTAAAD